MDRMQRARNLLTELEALKHHTGDSSPLGVEMILGITLNDAEILVREILTEMNLREGLAARKKARALFPGIHQAIRRVTLPQSGRALFLRPWKRSPGATQGSPATP